MAFRRSSETHALLTVVTALHTCLATMQATPLVLPLCPSSQMATVMPWRPLASTSVTCPAVGVPSSVKIQSEHSMHSSCLAAHRLEVAQAIAPVVSCHDMLVRLVTSDLLVTFFTSRTNSNCTRRTQNTQSAMLRRYRTAAGASRHCVGRSFVGVATYNPLNLRELPFSAAVHLDTATLSNTTPSMLRKMYASEACTQQHNATSPLLSNDRQANWRAPVAQRASGARLEPALDAVQMEYMPTGAPSDAEARMVRITCSMRGQATRQQWHLRSCTLACAHGPSMPWTGDACLRHPGRHRNTGVLAKRAQLSCPPPPSSTHPWDWPDTLCWAHTGCCGRWRRCRCRWPTTTCERQGRLDPECYGQRILMQHL